MINSIIGITLLLVPFGSRFTTQKVFPISSEVRISGEKGWTDWSYFTVGPDGARVAFIDPKRQEVRSYSLDGGTSNMVAEHTDVSDYAWGPTKHHPETLYVTETVNNIARKGRKPDEVNVPIAVKYDRSGKLLVSDLGNRRISVFSPEGMFESSFLLPQTVDAPSDIRATNDGNYLLSNLSLDRSRGINAGYHCNFLSRTGKLLKSFAYTPKIAFERNLWLGVHSLFDLDERGNIYVAFTVEPAIYVYNSAGELTKSFGETPGWWVPPPKLQSSRFVIEDEPEDFYGSWTRVIKLVYAGNGKLILCAETNGLVEGCSKPFILDVYSTDGKLIAGSIESDCFPVGVDNDNMIYFLSVTGDRLLKTSLIEPEEK
ncbi:MAG: hypothetical protein KAW61_04640 [candidate division Zixibacteria bacterium]|nr:hypothetical protein [candidate division Zixibacteria bacterium]